MCKNRWIIEEDSPAIGKRLDASLADIMDISRSKIETGIKAGDIKHNGKVVKGGIKLRQGDVVDWSDFDPKPAPIVAEEIALEILYEDKDLLVVNKPPYMVVHPTDTIRSGTLVNALMYHTDHLSTLNGEERPGIVHRLDADTSGLLVIAKNNFTHENLAWQFKARSVNKTYVALIAGSLDPDSGVIEEPIARDDVRRKRMCVNEEGRPAKTGYRTLAVYKGASLVEIELFTGRTHQIRVHMAWMGHPILGDVLYGAPKSPAAPRQMLHAKKIAFDHPGKGDRMHFECPLPDDFNRIKTLLEKQ